MRSAIIVVLATATFLTGACTSKLKPPLESPATATEQDDVNAAPGDVELTELPAMQADLIAKAGSDTIYFGTDEHLIDDQAKATLAAQAKWLLANPDVRASIEGHADERGTREYNMALGERRASAARDFLLSQGVQAARLLVTSWGKERPVATGSDESAWAQNRRAVTVVVR